MLLPAFFAYAFSSRTTLLVRTGIFFLGLSTALVPLGAAAGSAGALLREHAVGLTTAVAVVVIVLGVVQALAIDLPMPRFLGRVGAERQDAASPLSVYLLGVVYGLAGVGCAGPILGAVLAMAGFGGSPLGAAALMLLYAAGMAAPLGILALLWEGLDLSGRAWLRPRPLRLLGRHTTVTNLVSGLLFVILGVVLLFTGPANPLGGLLDGDALANLESSLLDGAARIPWWAVVGMLAALGGAVVLLKQDKR